MAGSSESHTVTSTADHAPPPVTKNNHLSAAQPSLRRAVAIQRSVVWLTKGRVTGIPAGAWSFDPLKRLKAWPSLLVAAPSPSTPMSHQPNWYWQPTLKPPRAPFMSKDGVMSPTLDGEAKVSLNWNWKIGSRRVSKERCWLVPHP